MTPVSLTIKNFGPFKEAQTFEFPQAPGLYFLWGENQEEPRLEANGAGKSRLWGALCWVLFGKLSNGLKAGDVANWEARKGTQVDFIYFVDNDPSLAIKITRTWSPNSWTMTDWRGDEYDIPDTGVDDLRLGFTPFLNSILLAQGQPMFLDLKAEAKASLFSEVLDLDRWIGYSKRANEAVATTDEKCRKAERELADAEGRLDQLGSDTSLQQLSDQWEASRNKRIQVLEQEHARLLDTRKALKRAETEAQEAADEIRAVYRKLLDGIQATEKRTRDAKRDFEEVAARLRDRAVELEACIKSVDSMEHDRVCPLCSQKIGSDAINKASDQLQALSDAIEPLQKHYSELQDEYHRLAGGEDRDRDSLARQKERVDDAERRLASARSAVDRNDHELDAIESEAEDLENEVNPHADHLKNQWLVREGLEERCRRARANLRELEDLRLRQSLWVSGFKDIRLSLITEALEQFELEVNSCVTALGLVGWSLEFSVDRETQRGSILRGFNVMVRSPHNERAVPWESWSGGEGQRLRVAAQQGLGNLIRSRTGTQFNLEVWDEPTQWMSAQGVTDLLDSLAERAQTEERQIWVVDHRTLGYGNFTGSSGVIKTREGFSIFDQTALYISGQGMSHARAGATTGGAGSPPLRVRRRTRSARP